MPIDIGFVAFFVYGFWHGYHRGIISTVFNLALYVFGFVMAFKISPTTTRIMQSMFHSDNPTMYVWAFLVNLLTIMLILRTTAKGLEGAMRMVYLGIINQIVGGVAMGGFLVLVYSVLVWFGVKVQFINDLTLRDSKTYTFLEPLPGKAKDVAISVKPFVLEAWNTSLNWMDRVDQYGIQRTEGKDKTYRPPDNQKAIEDEPASSKTAPPPTARPPSYEDSDGIEE